MKNNYIPRSIEPELMEASRQFPVIVVTGARQTGKSTVLQHVFSDALYLSLDDPLTRKAAQDDPRTFLKRAPQIIIDEIQYVPELLSYIKVEVDADRRNYGRFLLTGSQHFSMMQGISESLAGRAALFQLYPFSVPEINFNPKNSSDCFMRIFQGFYPDIVAQGVDRHRFLASYVQTYLERDVRMLTAVQDLSLFQSVVELLATRIGNLLNLNDIAKEVGVSLPTVRRWLSILESTGIIFLLRPYARNMSQRVVKTPKLYFADTGLAAWLLRYPDATSLEVGPQSGALFENLVILECLKHKENHLHNCELFFYRDSNGNEIDLIVSHALKTLLIEIKQTATPRAEHFKTLKRMVPKFSNATGLLACQTNQREPYTANLTAIPWQELISAIHCGLY